MCFRLFHVFPYFGLSPCPGYQERPAPQDPPGNRTRSAAKDTARVKVLPSMTFSKMEMEIFSSMFQEWNYPTCWMKTTSKNPEVVEMRKWFGTWCFLIGFGWLFNFCMGQDTMLRCHIVYPSTFDIWLAEFILPDIIHVLVHNLFFLRKNGLPLSGFKNVSEDVWTVPANILYIKKYICYNHTYSWQKIQHVRFWEASKKQKQQSYTTPLASPLLKRWGCHEAGPLERDAAIRGTWRDDSTSSPAEKSTKVTKRHHVFKGHVKQLMKTNQIFSSDFLVFQGGDKCV